jgi:hypothetical protein
MCSQAPSMNPIHIHGAHGYNLYAFLISSMCYTHAPSIFDLPSNISLRVKITELLIHNSLHPALASSPLRSKYAPKHEEM